MLESSLDKFEKIKYNIKKIQENIYNAAIRSGRNPEDIKLLAATKTVEPAIINYAAENGIKIIGENKAQELLEKYDSIDKTKCEIHFIGHLQTNKVKQIINKVSLIHSVTSVKLANEISKQAKKAQKQMDILLEVNIANEESKDGFTKEEIKEKALQISRLDNINIKGLMIIPPKSNFKGQNNKYFNEAYKLAFDIIDKKVYHDSNCCLSMGMSNDYLDAIACGADIIRIGCGIFGARKYV